MSRGSSLRERLRRGVFYKPQTPGGRIRALGFPRIRSGARSRLPPLRVGSVFPVLESF